MFRYTTPAFLRVFYPSLLWQMNPGKKEVFITFDDGPHPEITPWTLEQLDKYGARATFFMVGENARKNPETVKLVADKGHTIGNHTMNHLNGWTNLAPWYRDDVLKCDEILHSKLFRPPYGRITPAQIWLLKNKFDIVMWSLLSRDFEPDLDTQEALEALKENTEDGSIVVFHDSAKAFENLKILLPAYLDFCRQQGLIMKKLPSAIQ